MTASDCCRATASECACGLQAGHSGPHECADRWVCGGAWLGDGTTGADFRVVRWPGSARPARPPVIGDWLVQSSLLASRLVELEQRRLVLDNLFPPQPPATGWKLARQTVGDWVSNARTRLALWIAPWLEIR